MPRTRGMKLAIKEAEKILREKGPMTADELKSTLISLPKLKIPVLLHIDWLNILKESPLVYLIG